MAKGKVGPHAHRAQWQGKPMGVSISVFIQFMGFSTQSLDHLLLLNFGCISVWCQISWMGSYRSTLHPSCWQAVDGTWSSLGGRLVDVLPLGCAVCCPHSPVPQSSRLWHDCAQGGDKKLTSRLLFLMGWQGLSPFSWLCPHVYVCVLWRESILRAFPGTAAALFCWKQDAARDSTLATAAIQLILHVVSSLLLIR